MNVSNVDNLGNGNTKSKGAPLNYKIMLRFNHVIGRNIFAHIFVIFINKKVHFLVKTMRSTSKQYLSSLTQFKEKV